MMEGQSGVWHGVAYEQELGRPGLCGDLPIQDIRGGGA